MKQKKFRSATAAKRFAPKGWKAVRGKKTKLKDGTTAYYYKFVRTAKAKKKR